MSSSENQLKQIADIPKDFIKDGTQFLNRCTKRTCYPSASSKPPVQILLCASLLTSIADKREFLKISQAVGVGFVIMGTIGYFVKLIHIPVNNILVGGA